MTAIPWQNPARFKAACHFLAAMDDLRPGDFDPVRKTAAQVGRLMARLDPAMTAICRSTCPGCRENCCVRATIWYDFKDLLFLHFSGLPLPGRQIIRPVRDGKPACMHLTVTGCALPRPQRPFVCTWYLCFGQKHLPGADIVQKDIVEIRRLRRVMEDLFCDGCL